MFLYLVGNGKDPKIAVRDILEMGDSYFDREAIAHVENLPEAVANADGDYDYWDEHLKESNLLQERQEDKWFKKVCLIEDGRNNKQKCTRENIKIE